MVGDICKFHVGQFFGTQLQMVISPKFKYLIGSYLAICGCVRIAAAGSLFPAAIERRAGAVSGRNTLHGALKNCVENT